MTTTPADPVLLPDDAVAGPLGAEARGADRVQAVLRAGLAVAAAVAIGAYAVVAVVRLRSAVELEWIEGGMVDQVRRTLDGEPLYGPPTLTSIPYLYTPLFTLVGAALSWIVGVSPEPLRAVSIASSLVAFWATARLVVAETGDRWAGLVGAGVLAASYVICGAWFDVGRVDSLMLALTVAGALRIRTATTDAAAAAGGVLLVLAVLAKQDALLPAAAVLLWLVVADRRRAAVAAGTTAVGLLAAGIALQLSSGGWAWFYLVDVPRSHEIVHGSLLGFFTSDLRPFAWTGVAAVVALLAARRRGTVRWWFVASYVASMVMCGWLGRIHSGGWDNVLMPAVAAVALLAGLAAASARRLGPGVPATMCLVLLLVQFWAIRWAPWDQVPSADDERAAVATVAALRDLPGPVYLPAHPWWLSEAGGEPTAQSAALADVLRGPPGEGRALARELDRAFEEQRFAAVVVDSQRWMSYLPDSFEEHYRYERDLLPGGRVARSTTGFRTGPAEVWVPR
ncbi:glycosyltransferase 87 family protein [Dermatobacter hominis]|uniref:glycosyltransferase 87 family protein n=1 Tax=Dermatobacter hominis TaxID=2884263 RepID=UPI001D1063CC|nr:glycosyltransferase 87 family protein [Dermatobacter hominis]UDY37518.1 glycosyltransferase 87 family protein [Dermatobacter hominis]